MKTDLNYIKKLVKIIESGSISEIEIEEEGTRLKVVKSVQNTNPAPQFLSYIPQPQLNQAPASGTSVAAEANVQNTVSGGTEKTATAPGKEFIEIRSPIVGTFYRAPSPNADPYVQVGQTVSKGTVLCIIEAMKLMNEIESEYDGKIVKIMVENGQPVEYNQVIFLIEPN